MYLLRFLKAFPIPSWAVGVGGTRALLPRARALPGKPDFVTTHKPGYYTVCLGVKGEAPPASPLPLLPPTPCPILAKLIASGMLVVEKTDYVVE